MLLPTVTAWSAPAALHRYADCARAMGVADEAEGDQSAVARLLGELAALNRELEVPGPGAWGIDAARWEALVTTMCAQAAASGLPANNPRVPDAEEMAALYAKVWAGEGIGRAAGRGS